MPVTPTTGVLGVTVTTPNSAGSEAAANLADLVRAVVATAPMTTNFLLLQVDPANTGGTFVFVGDKNLTTARCGAKLAPGNSITFGTDKVSRTRLSDFYILGSAASVKLNVLMAEGTR